MQEVPPQAFPEPSRHGYWGPLPGESVELYSSIGVPALIGAMKKWVPASLRGDFDLRQGQEKGGFLPGSDYDPSGLPETSLSLEEQMKGLINFTKRNEVVHIAGATAIGALEALTYGHGLMGDMMNVVLGVGNFMVCVLPIPMNRYTRLRAYRLLDRRNRLK